jgi:hypothetical protein
MIFMDNQNNQFNGQFNQEQFHQFHQQQQQAQQQPLLTGDGKRVLESVMKANNWDERTALNHILLVYSCHYLHKGGG